MMTTISTRGASSAFFPALVCVLTAGCGGGGSAEPNTLNAPSAPTQTGVFLDSPVSGLSYIARTAADDLTSEATVRADVSISGVTGTHGEFQSFGDVIEFYIGDIALGAAFHKGTLTPLDLSKTATREATARASDDARVINVLRFLQSLDADRDPSNGIEILDVARLLGDGVTIEFEQSVTDFENDEAVKSFLAAAMGDSSLVGIASAQAHFEASLNGLVTFETLSSGDSSGVETPINGVISEQAQWQSLWDHHNAGRFPVPELPVVDFTTQRVVALFAGTKSTAGYQLDVVSVTESATEVVVHFVENLPTTDDFVAAVLTQPHQIFVIPLSPKPVVFSTI